MPSRFKLQTGLLLVACLGLACPGKMPSDDSPGSARKLSDRARMEQERSSNPSLEERIDEQLSRMTLEEKIGQMTMINFMDDPTRVRC